MQMEQRRQGRKKRREDVGREEVGREENRVGLQTSLATCRCPGVTGLFPGLPGRRDLNSALLISRTDQNQNLSFLSTPEVICP